MRRSSGSSRSWTPGRRTIFRGRKLWPPRVLCRRCLFSAFLAGIRPPHARSITTSPRNSVPAGRVKGNRGQTPVLRKRRNGGLDAVCHRFRMAAADQFPQLFNSGRRHVHHQQDLAGVDVLLEKLEPRVRHRHRHETRRPRSEDRADNGCDQHRDKLQRDPLRWREIDVDADQKPAHTAKYESQLGPMHRVGLLQIIRFMQLAQGHPSLGEEMHVPILYPREQQIVGRLDGAAQIGQQEVNSASHARLLSETRLADRSYPAALPKSSCPRRDAVKSPPKLARQSLANVSAARGKSGLHRAGCWVTPRRREATKRATETSRDTWSIRLRVAGETRQPPPGATSNRRTTTWLAQAAGRWVGPRGDPGPRGMTVHDRTRLIGQLHFFFRQRAARSTHSVIAATISGDSPSAGVTRNSVFAWRLRIFSTIAGSSRFRCAPCARKSGTMTTVSIPLPARSAP